MRAIYTTTGWLEVDSREEAANFAVELADTIDLNWRAALERHGLTPDDVADVVGVPATTWRIA